MKYTFTSSELARQDAKPNAARPVGGKPARKSCRCGFAKWVVVLLVFCGVAWFAKGPVMKWLDGAGQSAGTVQSAPSPEGAKSVR